MMTEQEKLIREIKEDFNKEKHTKAYERVQRMAKTLSNNLYSEESHFIYELIQNAQDNQYNSDEIASLDFYIFDEGILTKNNEIGFSEINIKALCDFNDSSKSKNKELGFIGEKGIGFKSVFSITDKPAIHSNGYKFYFKDGEYIEPYWIESFDNYPEQFKNEHTTNIYLPYSKTFSNQADIEKKLNDIEPILILFLNKLRIINISNNDILQFSVSKEILPNNLISIKSNYKEYKFKVFNKVINCLDTIIEEKRENVTKRELFLAFPLQEIEDTRIFSFLPTEIETGLPFLIQADFLLNASRSEIVKMNHWNLWILDEIVEFFVEEFEKLREIDKYHYLKYLNKEKSTNTFIDKYYQQILEKLQEKDLFLTTDETFVKSSNITILEDFDFMFEYLKDIKYTNQNKERYSYLNNEFYIPEHIIRNWKITKIDKKEFLRIIGNCNKFFAQKFENNNLLLEKLLEYVKNITLDESVLNELPIIPIDDENGIIKFYSYSELLNKEIFFYLDEDGILNNIFPDSKVVSKKYKELLENITFYKNRLHIKQPIITDILKSLNLEFYKTIENNLKLLVYIKNTYKQDDEHNIICSLIANYKFLTKNNYFISHEYNDFSCHNCTKLYLAKEYIDESNSIENLVEKYCTEKGKSNTYFISDKYLEKDKLNSKKDENILKEEWNEFFLKLKINDDIKIEKNTDLGGNINFFLIFEKSTKDKVFLLDKLSKEDSVFLYKKLLNCQKLGLNYDEFKYSKLLYNYDKRRKDRYEQCTSEWLLFLKDFPIYINNKKIEIKNIYSNIDERLNKYFDSLPKEYGQVNSRIFLSKKSPELEDILSILREKKENNFEAIKNIYIYIQEQYQDKEIKLNEIPILKDNKSIEYISVKKLIWEDGKELELIDLKSSYGDRLKKFFINQIRISEKPTIKEYVEYLKTNPVNYEKSFDKFIKLLEQDIDKNYFIIGEKIILINKIYYSFKEIIFNDIYIDDKENKIKNLFFIEKKSESRYKTIVEKFGVKKLSNYSMSIEISDSTEDDKIFDIYMKLLNYLWDYLYSNDTKEFEKLKDDKNFIFETKSIKKGAFSKINVKIEIENEFLQINKKLEIKDNTIHICSEIDKRELVKEIANFLSEKTKQITSDKLELFYKDVYKIKEYTLEEYYKQKEIKTPSEEDDKFDNVFENIKLEEIKSIKNGEESDCILDNSNLDQEILVDNKPTIDKSENKNIIPPQIPQKKSTDFDKQKQENEKTVCPECNIIVNKKNLAKHLSNVHNKTLNNINENTAPDLLDAIEQHHKEIEKKDEELDPAIIKDKNKFMEIAQEEQRKDIEKSNQETKKRYSSSQIKEGKKKTRFFLEREYKGHCQICGFTFDKKNNQGKYFQLFDWLSEKITKQKSNGVYLGSSLCLCSKCWSILKFGDFKSKFIDNLQKEDIDLNKFTFDEFCDVTTKQTENIEIPEKFEFSIDYKIPIRLLNEDKCIFYTQEHFKRFFIFLSKE